MTHGLRAEAAARARVLLGSSYTGRWGRGLCRVEARCGEQKHRGPRDMAVQPRPASCLLPSSTQRMASAQRILPGFRWDRSVLFGPRGPPLPVATVPARDLEG